MEEVLLEMKGIVKEFPGVVALDRVDISLYRGECLALVGENGAGKSTLMKILSGAYDKTSGITKIRGNEAEIGTPKRAQELGIAIIYQELSLIPYLTVAENLWLGREPLRIRQVIDSRRVVDETRDILRSLGSAIDANAQVATLSVAEQQLVEIARAVHKKSDILIMDEPTASLTTKEIDVLFDVIRTLKARGVGIVYISHRLQEVFEIADRVTVLRDGKNAGEMNVVDASIPKITKMMIGREGQKFVKRECKIGPVLFSVKGASCPGKFGDVTFHVHSGEAIGVYGVAGAGQMSFARSLFGLERKKGRFTLNGKEISLESPEAAISHGLVFLTDNRRDEGLQLKMGVGTNISLSALDNVSGPFGYLKPREEANLIERLVTSLDVRASSLEQEVKYLSGGNQQKVLFARLLTREPSILVLCEPTRGIDVGAKVEIYELINRLLENGKGIVLVSSELPEVLALSDRIIVFHNGQITGDIKREDATEERVLRCALGGEDVA